MKLVINCNNVNLNPIQVTSSKPCNNFELVDSLNDILKNPSKEVTDNVISIPSNGLTKSPNPELSGKERSLYEVTAKIFLLEPDYNKWNVESLLKSFSHLNSSTGLRGVVDSLVLSFCGIHDDKSSNDLDRLDAAGRIYKQLSHILPPNVTFSVADFGSGELKKFINIIKDNSRELHATQISLSDCCEPPSDLLGVAKSNNVQLLAHPDLHDILSSSDLANTLNQYHVFNEPILSDNLSIDWVLKYTIVSNGRFVVANKGYVISASMDS